jgi:dTMP kinase
MTVGRFITFEGVEGVGKSTQLARLAEHLQRAGQPVVVTREPGGTPLAERIRSLVLHDLSEPMPDAAELMLMFAARTVHTENLIRPALARGAWVLCDRYTDATYAYQGGGRGVPDEAIAPLARLAQRGLVPDLTILLDAPVDAALGRARARTVAADRIEAETTAFFERVRAKYLALATREPQRVHVVEATGSIDAVAARVAAVVDALGTR